jgi:predicted RNA-binding Zn-ribbon protein involved in translation (DUF1610 family)
MSEPEIARRCSSCGASVRQRASFCPQCGQVIGKQPDSQADSQTTLVEGQETQVIATDESPPDATPITPDIAGASAVTQIDLILPEELRPHPLPMVPETQPLITKAIQREPTVSEADAITPHAADVARPATEHHLMDRVDRLRKVTSVIDQAAYDPSLRFLLVAAVLFILFVILMVLSKVIG